MASEGDLTEYERKRLENIKRNGEKLAALKIYSMASDLSAAAKRQRVEMKSYKVSPQKKLKPQTPIVIRRSLRTRGIASDTEGLIDDDVDYVNKTSKSFSPGKPSPRDLVPISFKDAGSTETGSDRALVDSILSTAKKPQAEISVKDELGSCVDLESMTLKPENVARIMPERILVVKFLPCTDVRMVVAGNKFGDIGFWNLDSKEEEAEENGIYLYHTHTGPISGIAVQQSCLSKIFTSCYDGVIRLMDAEKEIFDLVYSNDHSIYSLSQQPGDVNSLYFGKGSGGWKVWDVRAGKSSTEWSLHEARINTIDFNSQNHNIMATSSSDGTACLWDLRCMGRRKFKPLKEVRHKKVVHSAYFSPSGTSVATTSYDNMVGICSGVNFEDTSMVYHNNQTGRWISSFRAIWGWDDSSIFIGNMKRGVDVISLAQRKTLLTLQSSEITAIPCRFHAHPYEVGTLAGATSGGQVYVWTSGL